MIPNEAPSELQNLTQVEEMLITRAFPVMQVYTRPNGGQLGYRGHIITLPNDVQNIANVLPRHPKEIPIIVFEFQGKNNKSREIRVRREKILNALLWLTGRNSDRKLNNFLYKDITIDYSLLDTFPRDGFVNLSTASFDSSDVDLNEQPLDLGSRNLIT